MWLISLIAVILCALFLSKITVNGIRYFFEGGIQVPIVNQAPIEVSTLGQKPKDISSFEDVFKRNIFDSNAVWKDPSQVSEPKDDKESTRVVEVNPTGEAVKTKLPIKLISTFSVGAGEDDRSSAIISSGKGGKGGKPDVYKVNDQKNQFAPDTRIVRILFNKVEFINRGRLEYVELEEFAKSINFNVPPEREGSKPERKPKQTSKSSDEDVQQVSDNKFVIARSEIEGAIENLDQLYNQIRAVPHFKGGKPSGFKLYSVNQKSIFGKLGLKKGDILERINGLELDMKRGLQIFNQLKSESNINIDLTRRGKEMTLEYEIR